MAASPEVIDLTDSPVSARAPKRAAGSARQPIEPRGSGGGASGSQQAPLGAAAAAVSAAADGAPKRRRRKRSSEGDDVEGQAEPKPKGKKKEKAPEERRLNARGIVERWRPKPSQDVQARIERALPGAGGHRLFLIDRRVQRPVGSEGGGEESFAVLGATGNVYTVTVGRHPHCTCPDCAKGNHCKHILFVYLRVLGLPQDEPLVWQRALLAREADEVLSGAKSVDRSIGGGQVMASAAVREQYRRLSTGAGGAAEGEDSRQREIEGDCPICFDELSPSGEAVSFCCTCGNNVHESCMQKWVQSKRASGEPITCPLCRADWQDGTAPAGSSAHQQYANLAAYSEAHRAADTSLDGLYGDRSIWIRAHQGDLGRRTAANMWRAMGH